MYFISQWGYFQERTHKAYLRRFIRIFRIDQIIDLNIDGVKESREIERKEKIMFIGFKNGKLVTRTAEEKKKQPTIKDTSKKVRKDEIKK